MFFEAMYESLALVRKHGMGMILELDDTVRQHLGALRYSRYSGDILHSMRAHVQPCMPLYKP